jgi:hypothetical protein
LALDKIFPKWEIEGESNERTGRISGIDRKSGGEGLVLVRPVHTNYPDET